MAVFKKNKRENKVLNPIKLLNEMGFDLQTKKDLNPINYYNPDKEKYKTLWRNYDINQYCSYLVWEGLPNGLENWILNRMLYFHGSLCAFKYAGEVYILPYVMKSGINIYGLPNKIQPITYNGTGPANQGANNFFAYNFELPINAEGNEATEAGAVILYDGVPVAPTGLSPARAMLNRHIIDDIADVMARININIVVSNKKIVLNVKDPAQYESVKAELEASFTSDSPFIVISNPLDTESLQQTSDFQADDLFNVVRNYDAIRCFMNGITAKNFGSEKKERIVAGELDGNDEQINLIGDMRLEFAEMFARQCNKYLGTNISVKCRRDEYEEQVDGNGMTYEEGMEEL